MYLGPYIELFARKKRPDWDTWGTLALNPPATTAIPGERDGNQKG